MQIRVAAGPRTGKVELQGAQAKADAVATNMASYSATRLVEARLGMLHGAVGRSSGERLVALQGRRVLPGT